MGGNIALDGLVHDSFQDAGTYTCIVDHRNDDGAEAMADLTLHVRSPHITIRPIEIGSHYVALHWNGSLKVGEGGESDLGREKRQMLNSRFAFSVSVSAQFPFFVHFSDSGHGTCSAVAANSRFAHKSCGSHHPVVAAEPMAQLQCCAPAAADGWLIGSHQFPINPTFSRTTHSVWCTVCVMALVASALR